MSTLLSRKLRRDLRSTWPRFALMVLAIAICLTAFGAVLFAWAASSRETRAAYESTEPASATLVLDRPVSVARMDEIVAGLKQRPGIISVTGRTMFSGDVAVNGAARDIPLQVFVATPDDEMAIARFFMQKREWPPAADEVYVGRDSLGLLGVAVGDVVTVETPSGEDLRLTVADTVYDPSLSPSPQEQTGRGYLSTDALARTEGAVLLDQVKVQVAGPGEPAPSRDRELIAGEAAQVAVWLQDEYGVAVREVQVPQPGAHPHQWQADTLLLSLLAGGAAALLLSSILVATMLASLFTQQIPQIGIMKAVGARSGRIGRHYLAMTLLVAAVATAVALVPSLLLGRVAVTSFLGFLGIEPSSLAAPWWTYAAVLAIGLGLPPLMAVPPLVRASRTTVRAAIDHDGGGSRSGRGTPGLVARLSRIRRLDRGFLLALRNLVRSPGRFVLSVGLLACAATVFVAGMSLSSGVSAVSDEQKAERTWDVDVQLARPVSMDRVTAAVTGLDGVERVEGLTLTPTGVAGTGKVPVTRTYPDQGHGRLSLTAIAAGTTTFNPPPLSEGRWLRPDAVGELVLNQVTRKKSVPGVRAGDTVQLMLDGRATTWRVVGIAQEPSGGHGGLYTTSEGLAAATGMPVGVNQLRVVTTADDEATRRAVADEVEAALVAAGIEVRSAASVSRAEAISSGHLGPVVLILLGIALPLGVVGLVGLAATMSANVLERTREFGIMHAIGAPPREVRRIVVIEGVLLAMISCVVAALPALGLTAVLGAGLGNLFFAAPLPFRFSLAGGAIWLVLVTLGAVLATEAAASRAARLTVREALAYQ